MPTVTITFTLQEAMLLMASLSLVAEASERTPMPREVREAGSIMLARTGQKVMDALEGAFHEEQAVREEFGVIPGAQPIAG